MGDCWWRVDDEFPFWLRHYYSKGKGNESSSSLKSPSTSVLRIREDWYDGPFLHYLSFGFDRLNSEGFRETLSIMVWVERLNLWLQVSPVLVGSGPGLGRSSRRTVGSNPRKEIRGGGDSSIFHLLGLWLSVYEWNPTVSHEKTKIKCTSRLNHKVQK